MQVLGGDLLTSHGGSAMAEVFEMLELYDGDHGVNVFLCFFDYVSILSHSLFA